MSEVYLNPDKGINFHINNVEAPSFLKEYLYHLQNSKNLSQKTLATYYIQLKEYLQWLKLLRLNGNPTLNDLRDVSIADIRFDDVSSVEQIDIDAYLSFWAANNAAPASRALKLVSINKFYEYFKRVSKRITENPTDNVTYPRLPDRQPIYLSLDECMLLLSSVNSSDVERDYCILTFFLNCGFRVSELVNLNLSNIKPDGRVVFVGKGNHERTVFLNDACKAALEDYLLVRSSTSGADKVPALFISKRTGKRLTVRRVQQVVETTLNAAGLGNMGYTTHKLRHSAATNLYRDGADMRLIGEILGHRSASSTEIYTHVEDQRIKSSLEHTPLAHFVRESFIEGQRLKD